MTHHALSHEHAAARATRQPRSSVRRFVLDRFLLLPIGAAIALVWANVAPESYFRLAHALAFPVNQIGMAFFLALITQDAMETVIPGGAFHTWRRWGLALVAAAGGLAGSAVVYLALVTAWHELVLTRAWLVAGAIDVAAAYYAVRLIFRRGTALAFVLLVAFITDGFGAIVLAAWAPLSQQRAIGGALVVAAMVVAAGLRRGAVRRFWPYLAVAGAISWIGCYLAQVPAALALVPIVPFLPHEPRGLDVFADPRPDDPVHVAEHEWSTAVQVILFFFGLVNAGVTLSAFDTGSWAVMLAALVGRPLGMLGAIALGVAAGLPLPRSLHPRDLLVVALATSSGFTLALFVARDLLPLGAVQQQITLGALATVAGAGVALAVAKMLGAGRFARRPA